MNRRQKIIVSVVGIFIVLLALVGLTYGYFLTRIQGNTNTTSITVTTANLELTYGDGETKILTKSGLMPGEVAGTKDFTVTNNGDTSEYVVYIDEVTVTDATTNAGTEFKSNDFVYELTCTKNDGTECVGVEKGVFPMNNGILVGNRIEAGDVHTYQFKLTYLETNENQTDDMNKTLSAKINIGDIKQHNTEDNPDIESVMNPYSEGTLAYTIINNAKNVTESQIEDGYAELLATPKTKVAEDSTTRFKEKGVEGEEGEVTLNTTAQSFSIAYAEDYKIDPITGYFELIDPIICKYNECNQELINNYVAYSWEEDFLSENISDEDVELKKIVEAPVDSSGDVTVKVINIEKVSYSAENTLSVTNDDYGLSYYFRGGVKNNYVNFSGKCWRIVRVEGDGSVRLILASDAGTCETEGVLTDISALWGNEKVTYGSILDSANGFFSKADYDNPKVMTDKFSMKYNFDKFLNGGKICADKDCKTPKEISGLSSVDKLISKSQCIGSREKTYNTLGEMTDKYDDWYLYYETYNRLNGVGMAPESTLICNTDNRTDSAKVFPMTVDEVAFAGGTMNIYNDTYYLADNTLISDYVFWLTSSLANKWSTMDGDDAIEHVFAINNRTGKFIANDTGYIRPVVSLKPGISFAGGNGTVTSPYEIN